MCQFEHLFGTDSSYIVRCTKCGYHQVLFSGLMLTVNREEFIGFMNAVTREYNQQVNAYKPANRILISTPRSGVHLVLTLEELQSLSFMLEAAGDEGLAQDLINEFNC